MYNCTWVRAFHFDLPQKYSMLCIGVRGGGYTIERSNCNTVEHNIQREDASICRNLSINCNKIQIENKIISCRLCTYCKKIQQEGTNSCICFWVNFRRYNGEKPAFTFVFAVIVKNYNEKTQVFAFVFASILGDPMDRRRNSPSSSQSL